MPRKQPPTPRTGPKQTRLAGPNHHTIKNVRTKSSKSPAPSRQSALSSFGFSKGATPTTTSSSGNNVKKRVYASDDEIAETQFGLATQSFEGEEMGPPETPKKRRREVPSSHSPPGSPWTPKGAGGGIPFQLEGEGEGEERVVKSSQWWENEELCISTQRSSGEEVLGGVEDAGDPLSTSEPTTVNSLFPPSSPSPSLPTRDIKQETQSPSPPSPSPQTTQEHSQVNIMTTTTQIPINFRDTPIPPPPPSVPPAATGEPEAEESQESQLPYHHGDEILPPSPTQSMGEDEFERDDGDDGDDDGDIDSEGLHAFNPVRTQQLPSSFYHRDGRESSPPTLPAVLTGGFSSQSLPAGELLEGGDKEEEEEGEEEVAVVEERGGRRRRPITVSQLLPSSLMETFPLPPPLSQFSSYGYEVVPGSETQ